MVVAGFLFEFFFFFLSLNVLEWLLVLLLSCLKYFIIEIRLNKEMINRLLVHFGSEYLGILPYCHYT